MGGSFAGLSRLNLNSASSLAGTRHRAVARSHSRDDMNSSNNKPLLCPSAQPDMEEARVLGVVGGAQSEPALAYLNEHLGVSDELLASTAPAKPTQVFRFAARCQEKACCHFDGKNCNLASRIVQILPAVTEALPACLIRAECRWYQQEGGAACMRCPQVVTETYNPPQDYRHAALGDLRNKLADGQQDKATL